MNHGVGAFPSREETASFCLASRLREDGRVDFLTATIFEALFLQRCNESFDNMMDHRVGHRSVHTFINSYYVQCTVHCDLLPNKNPALLIQ